MATIQRPVKTYGTRSYVAEVAAAPGNLDPVLSNEVDADLDTIYAAWNGGTDTVNLKDGSVTFAKLAPDAQLWRDTGTTLTLGTNFATRPVAVPGSASGAAACILGTTTGKGRIQVSNTVTAPWLALSTNRDAFTGTVDDATKPAWSVILRSDADNFAIQRQPAGGAIAALLTLEATGQLKVPGPTTGADQQSLTLGSHTQKARLGGLPGLAGAWLTVNEAWNGSAWVRDDTAQPAGVLSMQPGGTYPIIFTQFSAAGAPTELLKLDNAGSLTAMANLNTSNGFVGVGPSNRGVVISWNPVAGQVACDLTANYAQTAFPTRPQWVCRLNTNDDTAGFLRQAPSGGAWAYPFQLDAVGNLTISGQVLPASYQGGQVRTTGIRCSQGGGTLSGAWSNQIGFGWTGSQITAAVDNIYNGTVNITPPSDERLKIDIEEDVPGLDAICALRPVTFRYKPGLYPLPADGVEIEGPRQYGLIAQEAQPHVPLVIEDDGSDEHFLGLDYRKLVPVLIRAVQELTTRVVALEGATA
jgi:hypothetical protein